MVRRLALAALIVLAPLARPANALESLVLNAPGASDELVSTLRASSLLLTAQTTGRTSALSLMAAARAEYGRLIPLLYEDAYYAPVIHVTRTMVARRRTSRRWRTPRASTPSSSTSPWGRNSPSAPCR